MSSRVALRKLSIGLGAPRSILLDRACGYLVLVVIYIAAFPSLLRVLPGANERAAMLAILGTAILGFGRTWLGGRSAAAASAASVYRSARRVV